jgi:dipeptidyl-peptidase-4
MRYYWLLLVLISNYSFAQNGTKQITLEDIFKNNTFRIKNVPGFNAMKDGKLYTQLDQQGDTQQLRIYNLETGKQEKTIFDNLLTQYEGKQVKIDDYSFSEDERKLLLRTESKSIYRRSVLYKVYVYDLSRQTLSVLDEDKVLHATFSPDGTKVAFVKDNNLYYKDLKTNQRVQLTSDGVWNKIINGNCDWVYEEEFEFTRAFQWSPDGNYIAFYRFDESKVPQYTLPMYDSLYPHNYEYKYPKAGEPNSVVDIKIYSLATGKTINAYTGAGKDEYIPRIKWSQDPGRLCVYRMNRHQNHLDLLLANATYGNSDIIYSEDNKYYIEINDNLEFLPDGHSIIFTSERDGYDHLYKWDWKNRDLTLLTKGKYDIAQLIGIDKTRQLVYYAAAEKTPLERKLYSVSWDGRNKKLLTPQNGTHSIATIEGYQYFLDRFSTLTAPPVYYLLDNKGKIVRTLEDNSVLRDKIKEYELGKIEFTAIPVTPSRSLNAWIIYPPAFNANKKYPVLMYQYSGPGSQEVADRFPIRDFFWHQMLAQKGYIIVCADGLGTGMRGEAFKKATYLQLGKHESEDQASVARYLGGLSYVDKERIGIWGWSYGGFMSSTCILNGNRMFKTAIAVAPVTNWRYYDNIYTERYMRTPQENPKGYDENAPEKMAGNLKGKFLLIHGTADDNVHFQNSVMLVDGLIRANKEFDSEYYPNKAHGISGGNTRLHLYKRMTDFILNNL